MLLVMSDRDLLLECAPQGGRAVELGVFTGEHAARMLQVMRLDELHLVDTWSYDPADRNPFPDVPEHMQEREQVVARYFGDDPDASLEAHYRAVVRRFEPDERVTIHRCRTSEAASLYPDGTFDMVYVDANHQYEYVLRDLLEWGPKLRAGGLMFLNDFYDSEQGRRQNLGVVGAAAAFVKRSDFDYIALSSAPFSDLVISNDPTTGPCQQFVDNVLTQARAPVVELPDSIVPHFTHKVVHGPGVTLELPSFV